MSDLMDIADVAPGAVLSANDRNSPVWAKVRKHMEAKQVTLRLRLETQDLDPTATAKLRGELKAIRNLLALGTPDLAMVADEE